MAFDVSAGLRFQDPEDAFNSTLAEALDQLREKIAMHHSSDLERMIRLNSKLREDLRESRNAMRESRSWPASEGGRSSRSSGHKVGPVLNSKPSYHTTNSGDVGDVGGGFDSECTRNLWVPVEHEVDVDGVGHSLVDIDVGIESRQSMEKDDTYGDAYVMSNDSQISLSDDLGESYEMQQRQSSLPSSGNSFKISKQWIAVMREGTHAGMKLLTDGADPYKLSQRQFPQFKTVGPGADGGLSRSSTWRSGFITRSLGERLSEGLRPWTLHPRGPFRAVWNILCILLLLYDGFMVPVDLSFEIETEGAFDVIQFVARCFWTADIVLGFMTGYVVDRYGNDNVEMRPMQIALKYGKSWFLFDICLVGLEWTLMGFSEIRGGGVHSWGGLFRSVKGLRMLRMLRLLRLARLAKLKPVFAELVVLSSTALEITFRLLKAVFFTLTFAHFGACFWHWIGDGLDNGWIVANRMESYAPFRLYSLSLHWMFIRLQGSSSQIIIAREPMEVAIDTIILFVCILQSSLLTATVAQTMIAWSDSDAQQVQNIAYKFIKRHNIKHATVKRIQTYLRANSRHSAGDLIAEENKLIRLMPSNIQVDLHYENRNQIIAMLTFFKLLAGLQPRCVVQLCHEAIADQVAVEQELIFDRGDACQQVYFVRSGELEYAPIPPPNGPENPENILADTPRPLAQPRCPGRKEGTDIVRPSRDHGATIAEAGLWTHWEHTGALTPMRDSWLLVLSVAKFTQVVLVHRTACVFTLRYAKHFVWHLNRNVWCDLIGFDFDLETLDQDIVRGTAETHFAFISHYKVEAGTEATLVRGLLERCVLAEHDENSEYASPIFVDSEDLTDLTTLRKHVEGSKNLVILLTPGLFSRPWCILEMVTAVRNDVRLVPVEVQKPGIKYQYPDEDWYRGLRNGEVLDQASMELLAPFDITLDDCEKTIRKVFTKIALPLSPHKSGNVQNAEIADIMKRCMEGTNEEKRASEIHHYMTSR